MGVIYLGPVSIKLSWAIGSTFEHWNMVLDISLKCYYSWYCQSSPFSKPSDTSLCSTLLLPLTPLLHPYTFQQLILLSGEYITTLLVIKLIRGPNIQILTWSMALIGSRVIIFFVLRCYMPELFYAYFQVTFWTLIFSALSLCKSITSLTKSQQTIPQVGIMSSEINGHLFKVSYIILSIYRKTCNTHDVNTEQYNNPLG